MKKELSLLTVFLLTICPMGFAFDRIVPVSTVRASEAYPVLSSDGPH